MQEPTWPSAECFTVTKSDTTDFTAQVRQIYVGTGGDVSVVNTNDSVVLFKNVMSGTNIGPFFIKRVNSTGTTASDIVAFY